MDATLGMLANEVRGKTLRLLADVTDEQARFTGNAGLHNSILWHAGHAVIVVEVLGVAPTAAMAPEFPAGWREIFGGGSNPAAVTQWPTLAEVVAVLQSQLGRLIGALERVAPERIDQVVDAPRNRTLRYSVLHGLHDEANHQGEIYLLKKLWVLRNR